MSRSSRRPTESATQKWSQVFNQEGGNGKVKCIVERPSYLSADALAQMEGESVTSSTRVPTTLRQRDGSPVSREERRARAAAAAEYPEVPAFSPRTCPLTRWRRLKVSL